MLYGILFLLINIEYVSFYYVFWGKRANIKYDWKMLVTLCISVLLLVLSIRIGNLDILCVPAIISGVLINSQIYRLRVSETIKLALVSFPLLSILESIFEFILMYGVKLDPEYVNIVYTVVVVAIIWIYYWTIGRRIDKDAFTFARKNESCGGCCTVCDRGYDLIFYICFGGCFANRWRNDRAGDCYSRWCSYSCT